MASVAVLCQSSGSYVPEIRHWTVKQRRVNRKSQQDTLTASTETEACMGHDSSVEDVVVPTLFCCRDDSRISRHCRGSRQACRILFGLLNARISSEEITHTQ